MKTRIVDNINQSTGGTDGWRLEVKKHWWSNWEYVGVFNDETELRQCRVALDEYCLKEKI